MATNVLGDTDEEEPRTLALYITSFCKDFIKERQILLHEVIPDLQAWCESRNCLLQVTDIRWGGQQNKEELSRILDQVQEQYFQKHMPLFINLTCGHFGITPCFGETAESVVKEYQKLLNIAVNEAHLQYNAYREDNVNGILLVRDDEFLECLSPEEKVHFLPTKRLSLQSQKEGKALLASKFKASQVVLYTYNGVWLDPDTGNMCCEIEESFASKIMDFLKQRISSQLGEVSTGLDIHDEVRSAHHTFMNIRNTKVRGRESVVKQIEEYVCGREDTALLLLGGAGSGKSSIMAKAAHTLLHKAKHDQLPCARLSSSEDSCSDRWHVFYHFVGALPGSTDLGAMLRRLLRELDVNHDSSIARDTPGAAQLCSSVLSSDSTKPVIILVDAVNQFDECPESQILSWLPWKLAAHVRCVLSMINDTAQHRTLMARETHPIEMHLMPLDLHSRQQIVQELFGCGPQHRELSPDQMRALLCKKSSENPLWLWVACEELRLVDTTQHISHMIEGFPDGLLDLLEEVLSRLEQECGGPLLVATVCLLEVSQAGLMEDELTHLLGAHQSTLVPPSPYDEKEENEDREKDDGEGEKCKDKCSSEKGPVCGEVWSRVYRGLRPFLRPYGDSGQGRLDFYHRALSKAVRRKYLKQGHENENREESQDLYHFWHQKLADFFENSSNLERKAEEYLYHLSKIQDQARLASCLSDWDMMGRLYNEEHSSRLLMYWREAGGTSVMIESYKNALNELEGQVPKDEQLLAQRYEQVARIFLQAGSYSDSLDLTTAAIKWEEKELGNRPDRMVELYQLMAEIYDEKLKLNDFVSPSQLPDLRRTISYGRKSISLRQTFTQPSGASALSDDMLNYHKSKLGLSLMKLAFSLESWEACGGDVEMSAEEALREGNIHIDRAMDIFKQLNDSGHYAEALMTKGVLADRGSAQQLEHYNKAMEICRQVYGDYSLLTSRLYINIGIVYEDNNDYVQAFEYFKKWGSVSEMVLGPEHPKTQRAKGVLREPRYCLVADRVKERELQLAERGNEGEGETLSLDAINREVELLATQEVHHPGYLDMHNEDDDDDEEGENERREGEGELIHVTEELQQAINDLLQRALGELELTQELRTSAQAVIDRLNVPGSGSSTDTAESGGTTPNPPTAPSLDINIPAGGAENVPNNADSVIVVRNNEDQALRAQREVDSNILAEDMDRLVLEAGEQAETNLEIVSQISQIQQAIQNNETEPSSEPDNENVTQDNG